MRSVLFFGRLSGLEAAGPAAPMDSDAFRRELSESIPEVANPRIRMVVNQTVVSAPILIGPDDEIAFLPPVSGG